MSIESIELVFENYESLQIKWEHIIEIRIQGQVKTKFTRERGFYECFDYILLRIDAKADAHRFNEKEQIETSVFERLDGWKDILYIVFIDRDQTKNRTIYVPWENSDDKSLLKHNLIQYTMLFIDGSMQVRIGG